jgi:hypothetical protein
MLDARLLELALVVIAAVGLTIILAAEQPTVWP